MCEMWVVSQNGVGIRDVGFVSSSRGKIPHEGDGEFFGERECIEEGG